MEATGRSEDGGSGRRAGVERPFRRRVVLRHAGPTAVEASIEDHIHHFEVRVVHDGERATAVEGRAVRAPWSLCPGAVGVLDRLVGARVGEVARVADPSEQCTHLLDLAVTAVRFAADEAPGRRIELTVSGWSTGTVEARAERDDGRVLAWTVVGDDVVAPEPYAGRSLGAGFTAFAATLDPEDAELALLLRRATWMGGSRGIDLDLLDRLSQSLVPRGSCFASQPERIELATRNRGSSLDELR